MRVSILPVLLAGASLVNFVAAEPIRIIETSSNANANIRLGHALANANVNGNDDNVARILRPAVFVPIPPRDNEKGFAHYCGASLREKAIHLSNTFRHALGMPLVETNAVAPRPGRVHILPFPHEDVMLHSQEDDEDDGKRRKHHDGSGDHERHPHHGHHGRHGRYHHRKSFLRRIHKAIKALGPWEGRAVAFVLGCGIGVLLRMFWVLSVLAYRTVRGERGEETLDHEYIVYERVPETLFVSPPAYADEKVDLEVCGDIEQQK